MLKTGADIALTHHERWDGLGYPKGLKREEINLYGRIVSLVDVFDPQLVDLFIVNKSRFMEIIERFPD